MSAPSSSEEILDQMLKLLDALSLKAEGGTSKMQKLAQVATKAVKQMQIELKQPKLKQLAELVRAANWTKVTEVLSTNFPATAISEAVTNVLSLAYQGEDLKFLKNVLDWVKNLDAELQPVACEELYKLIKAKHHTNKPLVLLLLKYVNECLIGVQDNVRAELEADCRRLIDRIVEDIKKKDYLLCTQATKLDAIGYFIPTIVRKFNVNDVDSVLLLLSFSQKISQDQKFDRVCLGIINALLKTFEDNLLLESEQALHLCAHVKAVTSQLQQNPLKPECFERLKLFEGPLQKLSEMEAGLCGRYRGYVEDRDKRNLRELHKRNWYMNYFVSKFVSWYFNGDSDRTGHLLAAARSNPDRFTYSELILQQLHTEMVHQEKNHTFDTFVLYNEFKRRNISLHVLPSVRVEPRVVVKVPSCVCLLLSSNPDQQLILVNKFFKMPLSVQNETVLCFGSKVNEDQIWSAQVDSCKALATFSFKSGGTCRQLNASDPDGIASMAVNGTEWKIKPVDEHHVKIFTEDGKFLTAAGPCPVDKPKRVVCVMDESGTDKQTWCVFSYEGKSGNEKIASRKRSRGDTGTSL